MKTFKLLSKAFLCLCCFLTAEKGWAQNVGISATSSFTPDASAGLDISYNNKGLLVPRVALTATNAAGPIASPAISLLVYNTATVGNAPYNVVPGYYYWNGVAWTLLVTGAQTTNYAWALTGNTGTVAGTNFIGTTDNNDFVIKTNNAERARATSGGNFAIGSTNFNGASPEKFLVDAGTTSSFNVISGKGNINSYLQLNIQNNNAGTAASSDVVATADNGNENSNYVDLGINSSTNNAAFFGAANDAYLYNSGGSVGGNFFIGTSSPGKNLGFLTGGGATGAIAGSNERMHIDGSTGNVGIGNVAPTEKMDITGNLKFSGAIMPNNNAGTAGYFLQSAGAGAPPVWASSGASQAWSLTGNTGTTAGTNFLGTTDAQDMVFKANNVERMRIVNGANATTGTTGDITIGDVNSGTLRSAKELVLRQDGDVYGPSTLRLRNRAGQNGAVFETTGGSANLVDFIFNTGAVASPISSNIRFETRSGNMKVTGNTTEWQFGQPDTQNGGPTLVTGASGTGSNSAFLIGNVGIGNNAPTQKLDITGNLKFSGALMPNNNAGTTGYFLQSAGAGAPPVWVNPSASQGWGLTGNAGTTAGTNFIGTTDAVDFVVKTNNTEKARVTSGGNFGIGGTAFDASNPEKLLVDAGTTSSINVMSGRGSINNYLQLNVQNKSTGNNASSDVVATNDAGTEANGLNFIDMGVNSSGYTTGGSSILNGISNTYLYSSGNDMLIGNSTAAKSLILFTGGTATSNERMRIDGNGNVGINNTAPTEKLDVTGNLKFSGALMPNNNAGTSGYMLQSAGAGAPPVWVSSSASQAWGLTGNTGTAAGTNFIGTTDAVDFVAKTNNTEKVRVTSAGNLGIGTATPAQKLDVNGTIVSSTTTAYPNYAYNSANRIIFGETTPPANETGSVIQFGSGSNTRNMVVAFGKTGVNSSFLANDGSQTMLGVEGTANPITFRTGLLYTATNIIASGAEVMRITNVGNVGIGTTTPAQKLDVNGSINASTSVISQGSVFVDAAVANTGSGTPGLILGGLGSGEGISSKRNAGTNQFGIDFYTAGNLRMSVTNTGNIGIGTNAPVSTLEVNGSVAYPILIAPASGLVSLSPANYTVIIPSTSTATIALPAVATSAKRIYVLVNQYPSATTVSSYISFTGSAVTTIPGQTSITVQSNGTNWYRIQ